MISLHQPSATVKLPFSFCIGYPVLSHYQPILTGHPRLRKPWFKYSDHVIAFASYSCAIAERGKRITPDEAAWIEKGTTTHAEVVAWFGSPRIEFPQAPSLISASTPGQLQRHPRLRQATYVHIHLDTAGFPFYEDRGVTQSQFWIVYDEEGLVRDYGFLGSQPDPAFERRQHTIAHGPQPLDSAAVERYTTP